MRRAFDETARRHEVLRTTYRLEAGQPVQVIHPPAPLDWTLGEGESAALEYARRAVDTPFDLAREWPLRQGLFRLGDEHHLLAIARHHIVFDRWSAERFEAEISAEYRSEPLPPLLLQYADYAVWEANRTRESEAATAHWTERLRDTPHVLELPSDRSRPALQTFAGDHAWHEIPDSLAQDARAFARSLGTTPFNLFLAVFEVLLFRYTAQTGFAIGIPTAGRDRPELEPLLGCFMRTLPLPAAIRPEEPFADLVRRVAESTAEALRHSDVPLDALMNRLGVERDLSRSPLFQAVFSYQNTPRHPLTLRGCEVSERPVSSGASVTDLTLYIDDTHPAIGARFEYATSLFDRARIERMAGHFTTLLESAIAAPATPVSKLRLLTGPELLAISARRSAPSPIPPPEPLGGHPDAVAIRFSGESIPYSRLDAMTGAAAERLRAKGATAGSRVAIRMERSPEMIATMLAIHRLGAAYVPIDPALPAERADFILADSGADQPSAAAPADLAYVIYTSGSTGQPKGVAIPHSALANIVASFRREPGFTAADTLLAVTTLSFDIAALEIFLPLAAGGTVALATREQAMDGHQLAALIESSGATVMQATPATWRMLIDSGWSGSPNLRAWCGGEALPRSLADALLPRVRELWNVYGPTETTIWSTVSRVTAGSSDPPIGRAVANTALLVLDPAGELVPDGVPGELHIGGAGLARGYVNAPGLGSAKFIEREGERWYRTGDLVRWLPDGQLAYHRRLDTQVKLRGHRIEPGEIEAVLARHESVAQCKAVVREERLVAYVVTRADPGPGALAAHCARHLPAYMMPAIVTLPSLPLNHSGKVDVKALPAPEPPPAASETPAADLVEQRLAAIWGRVLGFDHVNPEANFFDLGGHSLLAARLFAAIESEFGLRVPMVNLFQHPTVRGLASLLRRDSAMRAWTSVVPVKPEGTRPPLFYASRLHALACRHLVPHLDPDQPVLGLEPPGLEGGDPLDTVEALAAHYIRAMKAVQPAGPYRLCGHSFGGFIVYEMARQLASAGERVSHLFLLDCSPYILPRHHASIPKSRLRARQAAFHFRRALFSLGALWDSKRRGYVRDLVSRARARIDSVMEQLREDDEAFGAEARRTGAAQMNAYWTYRPGPYAGPIHYIRIAAAGPRFDERGGWQDLVSGPLTTHTVSGGHTTMMREPHVREAAAILRRLLD